ncbi:MAG: hypothetical protein J07HQX50_01373 [Haloquadratum sp. J07HQX50]|jgi:hypothetical protein|nr:MAG: hypothetical protein J07HQX50_01373 [Haloquadratum sp. J07HQX50]
MTVRHSGLTIDWLGYATTRIEASDGTVVYTDPGRYGTLTGAWESPTDIPHLSGDPYDSQDGDLVVITRNRGESPRLQSWDESDNPSTNHPR